MCCRIKEQAEKIDKMEVSENFGNGGIFALHCAGYYFLVGCKCRDAFTRSTYQTDYFCATE